MGVRSLGVAARTLSLLALAAAVPAERFAAYAIAALLSELARCATDFGMDPVLLRRAEGLGASDQRELVGSVLAIRLLHGVVSAMLVLAAMAVFYPDAVDLILVAAALQFLSQGLLQLGLNWRQANNDAHRATPALAALYLVILALVAAGFVRDELTVLPLPLLVAGELLIAARLLRPAGLPKRADLTHGYRVIAPAALPMAGIAILAYVNTRADSLLVSRLLQPEEAGRYLYFVRWSDLAPMLASGLMLPLVGKLRNIGASRYLTQLKLFAIALAGMPFVIVQIAAVLNPAYGGEPLVRFLLAGASSCRVGLAITTALLLTRWQDGALVRIATVTAITLPLLSLALGSWFGVRGLVAGVIAVELCNLAYQATLLASAGRKTALEHTDKEQ